MIQTPTLLLGSSSISHEIVSTKLTMETTRTAPSTSRFRFRDHNQEMDNGNPEVDNETVSDSSSISSSEPEADESELESMTAKGIDRLCSELLELKQTSAEDFQKNIFSNYLYFIRIFEEAGGVKDEVMRLKRHAASQKKLVKDLSDGIYLKILSEETINSIIDETGEEDGAMNVLFTSHTDNILGTLDILLSEHRFDEALSIFETEHVTSQKTRLEISEKKAVLVEQLKLVAENPRVSPPELQKSLAGLCRLGFDHLATCLLLEYYHSRIGRGVEDLQSSEMFSHGVYIRDLAKFVFSMISQATMSFVALYRETSPFPLELTRWASDEARVFAACFNRHVKSISEISGGLSRVAEAVQTAMSYCSLLEAQGIVLQPCLIECLVPCLEETLEVHFDHFKKLIHIFTSTDVWTMDRYLVTIGDGPEYCLLTSSGRKFVMMLQGIREDVSSLVSITMGNSIVNRLLDLFTEYTSILERALGDRTRDLVGSGLRINTAESASQKVSIIANLSTLDRFFSSVIRNVSEDMNESSSKSDGHILTVKDTCRRLRTRFCEKLVHDVISRKDDGDGLGLARESNDHDLMPSFPYQVMFVELRKVEELAEENDVEADWLNSLLIEMVHSVFNWISSNHEMWDVFPEETPDQRDRRFIEFALSIQFLVEIARRGGYLTADMIDGSRNLVSRMKSTLASDGSLHSRDVQVEYKMVTNAAIKALEKLEEMGGAKWPSDEEVNEDIDEETNEPQTNSAGCSNTSLEVSETSVDKGML